MNKLTVIALAASLALGAGSAWAQQSDDDTPPCWQDGGMMMGYGYHHHNMMWRDGHGPRHWGMFSGLNLSDAQRQQMRDIVRQYAGENDRAAWGEDFKQQQQIITGDKFDDNAVRSQLDAANVRHNKQILQRLKMEHQMYNVLTPEQKKAFNANAEQGWQQMQRWMQD